MAVSFKYWEDCLDPEDMEAMWMDPEVSNEWIDAGESREKKVHLSRDPDGQVFLTQTEMQEMIRAIAELESDRQPLATRYDKKAKDTTLGIMQMLPKTAQMLVSEMGYGAFDVEKDPTLLHRPFISVYFGAAYLKWLSNYDGKERNEEFVVRAYRRGPKKATHKSTLDYWQRYISVKQNLPARKMSVPDPSTPRAPVLQDTGDEPSYWDSRVSPENMEDMWNNPNVLKEWTKFGERRGKVRFSHDEEKKPYISRLELRAVSEIIVSKHFNGKGIKPTALCALAEVQSMRFVNGTESCVGISGIDYPKAIWLYNDLGNKAYSIKSVDDLHNPFVSIYFAAAYLVWLSQYEGRERTAQFVVQAYLGRPDNVNLAETGPLWLKFEEALSYYGDLRRRRDQGSCSVM
ncbi:hypothetical protein AQUCO_03000324v1 [Aquilegia coerulea]|uniref:Transglycosylase SLT domain-containing protein n=1 Tax=Aquilegia coerulea TaxID=218851 RepID=A0A2G5D2F3_AQUCA|nr:hypothetical protein AQUCO_03000324v1 [Aquilegia coerulea]